MIEARVTISGPLRIGEPARIDSSTLTSGHLIDKITYRGSWLNTDGTVSLCVQLIIRTIEPPNSRR